MSETNQNTPAQNRIARSMRKLLRLALLLLVLAAAALIAYLFFNSLRPLPEPRVLAKPDPALISLLNSGIAESRPSLPPTVSSPVNPPARTSQISTPTLAQKTVTTDTIILATSDQGYELIPEKELTRPEQKAAARQFNAEFRRWVGLLSLYFADPAAYRQLLKKETEPYGENVYVGYPELRAQLYKAGLGLTYNRKLSVAYLQLMAHYGLWAEAAWHCYRLQDWYTWNDFLYCMRRERRPLIKYPNIAIYSVLHLFEKPTALPNGKS